ncbi:cytochrome d ubiquinol oxidase subunit II [Dermatophilaceae bacterium Sec6.4]
MSLETFWFILIGVLWTGYLVLEGFDFGVGMLLGILGHDSPATPNSPGEDAGTRKRVLLNAIGPFWDGNEVWLITAGGATFAAFPAWYASMFSGFYLAFLLLVVALILRNMGLDYRHKRSGATWQRRWDIIIITCSVLAPLLVGVALTNLVRGVPLDKAGDFTGTLLTLLNPWSLLGGLTIVALSLTHGCFFIALKTDGQIRHDARALGTKAGLVSAGLAVVLLAWVNVHTGTTWSWITAAVGAVALLGALAANLRGREGFAFSGTMLTIGLATATYFLALFPDVMPSTTNAAYSLTVTNASSSHLTLQIMTGAALVMTPIVIVYSAWSYWIFRKRITADTIGVKHDPLTPLAPSEPLAEAPH